MPYDIYTLGESLMTISGGGQLDGVTQGDGSRMMGRTVTLNSNAWQAVSINDNDPNFQDSDSSQTLNGAQTIDCVLYSSGTVVEAEYSFVVSYMGQTWTCVAFNVNNSSPAHGTVEALAFIGGPGGFPPFGVPLELISTNEGPSFPANSYATPICFAAGTLTAVLGGQRLIEDIRVGDLVETLENGPQPVRWHGHRDWPAVGPFAPVLFKPGAIGNARPLRVSRQHRLWLAGWSVELHCGEAEVMVPAVQLVDGGDVVIDEGGTVSYHHLLFDRHEVIFAEGVAAESLHPAEIGLGSLDEVAREEVLSLMPELRGNPDAFCPLARPEVRGPAARLLRV